MTLPPRPLPPAPGHRTRRVYVGYTTHQCLKPHHPHLHTGALALALSRACVPAVCRGVWRAARVPVNAIPTRTRHLGALDSPPNNAHTFSSARPCGRTRTAPTPARATNNAHTFSGARPCGRIRTTPTPARATSRRLHSSQMYIKNAHTFAGARPCGRTRRHTSPTSLRALEHSHLCSCQAHITLTAHPLTTRKPA